METSSDPGRRSCGCRTGAEHQAAIAAIREARLANDKETNRVKSIEEYSGEGGSCHPRRREVADA